MRPWISSARCPSASTGSASPYGGLDARRWSRWSGWILDCLDREKKIQPVEGIGCEPVVITATREELLEAVSKGLREEALCFPRENGPIHWPFFRVQDALSGTPALFQL